MKSSQQQLGSGGVEDTTYKIDKYFRRIATIEMNLSERGRTERRANQWIISSYL